ncbi:uncharacterized protein LOC117535969 isoform X2 [Gymnodraco acuticeps]|uniref:Uncharacterized protein LOC117535969 isoform X2 n=1 Tax=Gymnodraco acuticeps TaxID=8218 RepID=A0A6P8SZK9_GYMAC|nr:uncharacterized protein LOC117535969 isoform X2 [Gymnodraco acuticeps]
MWQLPEVLNKQIKMAWIGLYNDVDSWSWSLSDTSFYKPGETEFRRWESGAPQNEIGMILIVTTALGQSASMSVKVETPLTTMKTCSAANFHKSGKWADGSCGWKLQFICYRQPVSMQVIKVRSNVDLNDRAFLDELLVKMKKEMRDKGLDDNIQLSWKKQADGQVFHKEEEKRDEL